MESIIEVRILSSCPNEPKHQRHSDTHGPIMDEMNQFQAYLSFACRYGGNSIM